MNMTLPPLRQFVATTSNNPLKRHREEYYQNENFKRTRFDEQEQPKHILSDEMMLLDKYGPPPSYQEVLLQNELYPLQHSGSPTNIDFQPVTHNNLPIMRVPCSSVDTPEIPRKVNSPLQERQRNYEFTIYSPTILPSSSPTNQHEATQKPRPPVSDPLSIDHNPDHYPKKQFLPASAVSLLKDWFYAHIENPYPSCDEKHMLMEKTGLSYLQITNWFTNIRKRVWTPKIKNQKK